MFEQLYGNDHVKAYLERLIERSCVPNSLLFSGPDGVGKSLFAESFAKQLLHIETLPHPDIKIYRPEGKIGMHSIDSMRQFSEEVYMPPYSAAYKIFIIQDADRMLTYSANALLKTFEEPAPKSIIILISSSPEALLPTVLSRCQNVRFQALTTEQVAAFLQAKLRKSEEAAMKIADLSAGSIGNALEIATEGPSPLRKLLLDYLSEGYKRSYPELVTFIKRIDEYVEQQKEQIGQTTRQFLEGQYLEGRSSAQQQAIDKEIDGLMTMQLMKIADQLFDLVLSWFRDMQLLLVNGDHKLLINKDYITAIDQAIQRGEIIDLNDLQHQIEQVRIALTRSTPLASCLEDLFLKIT